MKLLHDLQTSPPIMLFQGDCCELMLELRRLAPPVAAALIFVDPPFWGRPRWFKRAAPIKRFTGRWLGAAAAALDDGFIWINHEPQWSKMYAKAARDAGLIVLQQGEHHYKFNSNHVVQDWLAAATLLSKKPRDVRIALERSSSPAVLPAQQMVAAVIQACTAPGQWVIDPMCGSSGVVGLVARTLNRPAVLNDIDADLVHASAMALQNTAA